MAKVEEATFIIDTADLKNFSDRYTRIYFGNEFCQRLIPSASELEEVLDFILSKSLNFTFVTGFVMEQDLNYLQDLLVIISGKAPGAEVVINDWGMLDIVKKHNLMPVIGRLLTKQRRDPRILNLKERLTAPAKERSKSSAIGQSLVRFLKNKSIERMEIDNLPQGIQLGVNAGLEGLHFSLYFPFNYVTTSRQCIFNNGSPHSGRGLSSKCGMKCRLSPIELRHCTMPLPLYMKGNTIFLENRKMPDYLAREGIDRVIYQPRIPM